MLLPSCVVETGHFVFDLQRCSMLPVFVEKLVIAFAVVTRLRRLVTDECS